MPPNKGDHSCVEWLLQNQILYKLEGRGEDENPIAYRMKNLSSQNIYYFVLTESEMAKMIEGPPEEVD